MIDQTFFSFLKQHEFEFQIHEHEPIFTVEEGLHLHEIIKGPHCKSLFLKDENKHFMLLSLQENKRVDLKALASLVGKKRFSFGKPEELLAMLKLTPGSVTPYGLMFDSSQEVRFFLDEDLLQAEVTNFHPMRNDMTLSMSVTSFLHFFTLINHPPVIVKVPTVNQ